MSTKIHNGYRLAEGTAGMAPEPALLARVTAACAAVHESAKAALED